MESEEASDCISEVLSTTHGEWLLLVLVILTALRGLFDIYLDTRQMKLYKNMELPDNFKIGAELADKSEKENKEQNADREAGDQQPEIVSNEQVIFELNNSQ